MKCRCPAAILIALELAADLATESWRKTRSHRAFVRMREARTKALKAR
jgi:hypothetical protein